MAEASRRRRPIRFLAPGLAGLLLLMLFFGSLVGDDGARVGLGSEVGPEEKGGGLGRVVNDAIAGIDGAGPGDGESQGDATQGDGETLTGSIDDGTTTDPGARGGDEAPGVTTESDPDGPTVLAAATDSSSGPGDGAPPVTTVGTVATTRSPSFDATATSTTRSTTQPTTTGPSTSGSSPTTTRPDSTTTTSASTAPTVSLSTTSPTPSTTVITTTTTASTTTTTASTTTSQPDIACSLEVTRRAKLRAQPDPGAEKVGDIGIGVHPVLDRSGSWFKVSGAEATGWVTRHPTRRPVGNCD